MKRKNLHLSFFTLVLPLVWMGIIIGISFLEAPLKFTAPGVTINIGVGIGQIVFAAMNKLEWLLLFAWVTVSLMTPLDGFAKGFVMLLLLLLAQTYLLLPLLNERIELLQQGITPAPSWLHSTYIISELIKLATLLYSAYNNYHKIIQIFINKTTQHDQDSHIGSKLLTF